VGEGQLLGNLIVKGGYLYCGLISVIGLSAYWTQKNLAKPDWGPIRREMTAMILTTNLIFAYLAILAFAYRVYIYIPYARGGGGYTGEEPAIIDFDQNQMGSIPASIVDSVPEHRSKKVIIIRDTPDWMYVTLFTSKEALPEWREPGKWPTTIVAIRQNAIVSLIHSDAQALSASVNSKGE